MAAALMHQRAAGLVHVRSAGSDPAEQINANVVTALAELGVDVSQEFPKPLTDEVVRAADAVITMGCGDAYAAEILGLDVRDRASFRRVTKEIGQAVRQWFVHQQRDDSLVAGRQDGYRLRDERHQSEAASQLDWPCTGKCSCDHAGYRRGCDDRFELIPDVATIGAGRQIEVCSAATIVGSGALTSHCSRCSQGALPRHGYRRSVHSFSERWTRSARRVRSTNSHTSSISGCGAGWPPPCSHERRLCDCGRSRRHRLIR